MRIIDPKTAVQILHGGREMVEPLVPSGNVPPPTSVPPPTTAPPTINGGPPVPTSGPPPPTNLPTRYPPPMTGGPGNFQGPPPGPPPTRGPPFAGTSSVILEYRLISHPQFSMLRYCLCSQRLGKHTPDIIV